MLNCPTTLEEAKNYRYNQWSGNPNGTAYKNGNCAYEMYHAWTHFQCTKKAHAGPKNLYCGTHAKIVIKHNNLE
jgi:hypothetical protein